MPPVHESGEIRDDAGRYETGLQLVRSLMNDTVAVKRSSRSQVIEELTRAASSCTVRSSPKATHYAGGGGALVSDKSHSTAHEQGRNQGLSLVLLGEKEWSAHVQLRSQALTRCAGQKCRSTGEVAQA